MKPVIVFSYPRSGTHLAISSIAARFGFCVDSVMAVPLNGNASTFLLEGPDLEPYAIRKSHSCASEFNGVMDQILANYDAIYVWRDPLSVLLSLWNYYRVEKTIARDQTFDQFLTQTSCEFPDLTPMESLVQHQRGWLAVPGVTAIRYRDLLERFSETMLRVSKAIGRSVVNPFPEPPKLGTHLSIHPWLGKVDSWQDYLTVRQVNSVTRELKRLNICANNPNPDADSSTKTPSALPSDRRIATHWGLSIPQSAFQSRICAFIPRSWFHWGNMGGV